MVSMVGTHWLMMFKRQKFSKTKVQWFKNIKTKCMLQANVHSVLPWSLCSKSPGGKMGLPFSRRICFFYVKAPRSFGKHSWWVYHLVLPLPRKIAPAGLHRSVSAVVRMLRNERIRRYQTPPWCEAAGVLKLHLIPSWIKAPWIFTLFSSTRLRFNSSQHRASSANESLYLINARVCVKGACHIKVYHTTGQAGEEHSITF